jgi:hypothetical protein
MHVLYAEPALETGKPTEEGYRRYRASDDALAEALKRHAFAYKYVLPEQLTPEGLEGLKLLVLPSCVALSDAAVAGIRAFAVAGGKVLADVLPATHDAHGKPRGASALADLFAESGAICFGAYATRESAAMIDQALATLAVQPAVRWQRADGSLPTQTELNAFRLGEAEYLGLVRGTGEGAAKEGPLTIKLPGARYVYDCRAGRSLGRVSELRLDVPPGDARFLALLSDPPQRLRVRAAIRDLTLNVTASLAGPSRPAGRVLRVEIYPPGAQGPVAYYSSSVVTRAGIARLSVPLALNDPTGEWHAAVRDVATGMTSQAAVSMP